MTLHIAPARGWINDPNGITFTGGRWHVFYQHNPAAAVHGDIHWGHTSSADLVNWSDHGVAFGPTRGGVDQHGCWSGVFAPDGEHGCVLHTGVHDTAQNSTVCLRWALDDKLLTFSDPIVVAETPDGVGEMRDPYLFSFAGRRYALLGAGLPDKTPAILLFDVGDLLHWRYLGVWLQGGDPGTEPLVPAQIWECPQLVEVDGRWVLIVSLWYDHNLGPLAYLVLDLAVGADDSLLATPRAGGRVDTAEHAYAAQVVANGERPLMLSWVKHEGLPDGGPDAVAGCLSLPTRLSLDGDLLVVTADPAVTSALGAVESRTLSAGAELELPHQARVTLTGIATLQPGDLTVGPGDDLWVDGEVAEIFRHGPSTTLRAQPGQPWSLRPVDDLSVDIARIDPR